MKRCSRNTWSTEHCLQHCLQSLIRKKKKTWSEPSSFWNRSAAAKLLDATFDAELLAAAAGAKLLAARLGACDTASPPLDFFVHSTYDSPTNLQSCSLPNSISNLLRHSSVCTRSVVPVTIYLRPGCGHISHIGFPCVQPCSLHGPPVPPQLRLERLVWVLASGLQYPQVHRLPFLPPLDSGSTAYP